MSGGLIFEEPPVIRGGGYPAGSSPLGQWLASLRDHPGQWAKWPEPRSATDATNIKRGIQYGVQAGEFEVRTTKIEGASKRTLYARYIGGES